MKNNEFIAIKEAKIVFTPDGRILFLDKDTEVVNLKECTDCKQKDQRIAELEEELASQNSNELIKKKYDSLKEAIKFLREKQITDEHIFYVIDQLGQQHIDRIQDIENGICEIERLKSDLQYAYLEENNKVAIEKLEEVLKFIYGNKWTNIELCVDNSPLKIIRNKLDTMISGLKGDK